MAEAYTVSTTLYSREKSKLNNIYFGVHERTGMIMRIKNYITRNRNLILITFELFWIKVFVLARLVSDNPTEIPQFIYVNF